MEKTKQQHITVIRKALQLISKKLSFPIISQLHYGPMRFNQLKQKFTGISVTSLRDTLLHLEKHNMIKREIYAKRPIRMKYSLTKEGIEFIRVLLRIRKWSD
ncbi:helix-turn-helix transcriptional regulator [Shimazuella sp. AN120528]|uniref:winged helix-turn-helix transcriptional regulator n=1 Tax=Shimazuella soli TaxID=1892854 RepID=UPI001F1168D0|nr:helix-turn-helix domain-containing protein [Shimazuella soli]MCH5585839.1 helix-turn-helix transcriptional regulator [Shimazuella soli]